MKKTFRSFRKGFWFLIDRPTPIAFVAVLCLALMLSGCSFASFAAAAEADVPVVIQMVQNITSLVAPQVSAAIGIAGVAALAGLKILCGSPAAGAAECDATSLIGQIQAEKDANVKASLLQQAQIILSAINGHITDMLNIAKGIPAGIASGVVTAIAVALQTITLLLGLVPAGIAALHNKFGVSFTSSLKAIPHPNTLRSQFNAAIAAQYPNARI